MITTQATLQVISGYNPPPATELPEPTNYSSGSIISTSQIPGWGNVTRQNTGQAVYGGGANQVSSAIARKGDQYLVAGTLAVAAGSAFLFI